MGVIQRQSIKYTIVNLIGLGIGTLSTLFVYPMVLEENGLMRFLLDTGMVMLPLLTLGANTLTVRFFPRFQDEKTANHGFLPFILGVTMTGCALFGLLAWFSWDWILHFYENRSPLLLQHLHYAPLIAFFYVINQVLYVYSANFKRIVVPSLLIEFSQKIVMPILLIAVWQKWVSLGMALNGLVLHGFLVTVGMVIYLKWLGAWQMGDFRSFITPELRKEMLRYSMFGIGGAFALLVAARIDTLMVGTFTTMRDTGIFAISAMLATVIEIPIKGVYSASVSSVARYLEDNNLVELDNLYKKVSINLLVAGLLLFFSIWVSLDSLFLILPNGAAVSAGKWVFFFIGLSRLVEMTTGLNNSIIYYSRFYTYSLFSLGLAAVGTVIANLLLIPILGMTGSAVATLVSIVAYNAFTVGLVWQKFRLQPFSQKSIIAVLLALGAYLLAYYIPLTGWPWLDIAVRSGVFCLVFAVLVYKTAVSPDLNEMADNSLAKIFGKK